MFDILKKKITGFIDTFIQKEQKKEQQVKKTETPEKQEEQKKQEQVKKIRTRQKEEITLSVPTQIKGLFLTELEITKSDVIPLLEKLELELIEGDVSLEAAEKIKRELEGSLIGAKIKKNELHWNITKKIKETLLYAMKNEKTFDMMSEIKTNPKPIAILFLGTNGAGKTTSIAKIANLLLKNNLKVVVAAADTFRAAAIEQLSLHTEKLGLKIVKREYGSDPTAVAYDAINYAKAHAIDVVLIDTAGRQETNFNLISELKKMNRVISPKWRILIGESIAGQAIAEQAKTFKKEIGLDAIILTKLDCDPKGGSILSLAALAPIIYLGTGQGYEDLEVFDPEIIADRILGNYGPSDK